MATTARSGRISSFSRNHSSFSSSSLQQHAGVKNGHNGAAFVSSGIPDLDKILGGGFLLGTLVMVMEDVDAPHHLLLLRNFMSQGLVHQQPLLFASPSNGPRAFLGTLPAPATSSSSSKNETQEEKGLRIAWQYKKYFGSNPLVRHTTKSHSFKKFRVFLEQQETVWSLFGKKVKIAKVILNLEAQDIKHEFSNDFDLRKPLGRHLLSAQHVDCVTIQGSPNLSVLHDHCSTFLNRFPRNDLSNGNAGRIAIQSLCAPQCGCTEMDWDIVSFIRSLRAMVRSSNAVAMITFPASLLPLSFSKRWQHLADTVLSVRAIPDEDKDLAKLLTGYQDMVGLLHVHKVAQINTQVPVILEASTFSLKLHRRRTLILERLNQAPVDGSSGTSYATTSSCGKGSSVNF